MRIESLIRITGGVLLNTPSVTSINDIKIYPNKIQRENLFIDINSNQEEINIALENGAYAILTSTLLTNKDEETAWIYLEDLDQAIIKLARYYSTEKKFKFIPLSLVQYKLAKCIQIDKKAKVLSIKPQDALMEILKAEYNELFFVVNNDFIAKIDPSLTLPKNKIAATQTLKSGVFHSSFVFNDKFINNIRLSPFFIPYLCSLINYLDDLKVEYKIENFNNFEHFQPLFINNKLEKKDFGSTNKALIFESNFELFKEELNFLEERLDTNSLVTLIPEGKNLTCKSVKIIYKNFFEIKNLKDIDFRYTLIYGEIKDFEESLKMQENKQMSLF